MPSGPNIVWLPDLLYVDGKLKQGVALISDSSGYIVDITGQPNQSNQIVRLSNKALLPGLVNSHSHAFQRTIRGRTEYRTNKNDNFWTWREMMYNAASSLTPEDIYDASRMAFLEMALSGITSIGEFHYVHNDVNGKSYDDPNLMAKHVVQAARDVGLRIALLDVAYARAGYQTPDNPRQGRFIINDPQKFIYQIEDLKTTFSQLRDQAWVGIAPHSVRALPLSYLNEIISYANSKDLLIHMHIAEQPAEIKACLAEHNLTPIQLLDEKGLLSSKLTLIHAIHINEDEISSLARSNVSVCACPTTERNLGDGIIPVDQLFNHSINVALGTDSQVQIDLLEDARELEYHLRLQKLERTILTDQLNSMSDLASKLFNCATKNGAHCIGSPGGTFEIGKAADFFTIDINDPSIAGSGTEDLLSTIVFSASRSAITDISIGGKLIVESGKHKHQDEIVKNFISLQKKLWA
jgi:formimidoylglutamate deiminase